MLPVIDNRGISSYLNDLEISSHVLKIKQLTMIPASKNNNVLKNIYNVSDCISKMNQVTYHIKRI
jgi:hypothetical protein